MRFFKNGCNEEDGKWGEAKNGRRWVGFTVGEWEAFKVTLNSWWTGANPLFYEDPPYIVDPLPFSNCVHPPFPFDLQPAPHLPISLAAE